MTTIATSVTQDASALLGVYARVGPTFVAGEGCELIAADGSRYLDCVAGIAVNALGYGHPAVADAVRRALDTGLIHVSNLYHTEPGARLAEQLVLRSFADRVFFCNSGAEANEAAFKFTRRWSGKPGIVAFSGSFHGRLFASLAATEHAVGELGHGGIRRDLAAGRAADAIGDREEQRAALLAHDVAVLIPFPHAADIAPRRRLLQSPIPSDSSRRARTRSTRCCRARTRRPPRDPDA